MEAGRAARRWCPPSSAMARSSSSVVPARRESRGARDASPFPASSAASSAVTSASTRLTPRRRPLSMARQLLALTSDAMRAMLARDRQPLACGYHLIRVGEAGCTCASSRLRPGSINSSQRNEDVRLARDPVEANVRRLEALDPVVADEASQDRRERGDSNLSAHQHGDAVVEKVLSWGAEGAVDPEEDLLSGPRTLPSARAPVAWSRRERTTEWPSCGLSFCK